MTNIEVDSSDLLKLWDAMSGAELFLARRDQMNGAVHLGEVRYSPLTVLVRTEAERLQRILAEAGIVGGVNV